MTLLRIVFQRLRWQRRLLGVLVLAVILVTGFFALSPLYVRAVTNVGLQFELKQLTAQQTDLRLIGPDPIRPAAWDILGNRLGGFITGQTRVAQTSDHHCAMPYYYGTPPHRGTPRYGGADDHCYSVMAFSNLDDMIEIVEGHAPLRLAPGSKRTTRGADSARAAGTGAYTRGEVQVVISKELADEIGMEIGAIFRLGKEWDTTAVYRVVGTFKPVDEANPLWDGRRIALEGAWIPINLFQNRFDVGLIAEEGAYIDWVDRTAQDNAYTWHIHTDRGAITVDTARPINDGIQWAASDLQQQFPEVRLLTQMDVMLNNFDRATESTLPPVIFLSAAVLLLMLYHLLTTTSLVLEQQDVEWATFRFRGASTLQMMGMQALTALVIVLIGFVAAPFAAYGALLALQNVGPLAEVMEGADMLAFRIPDLAWALAGGASAAAFVMLILPAWPAARRSLLGLKQKFSRPPETPKWARYYLDLILFVVGIGFMIRLYGRTGIDPLAEARLLAESGADTFTVIGQALGDIVRSPALLLSAIAGGTQFQLQDPFDLAGPALILSAFALFWLRIFPKLMAAVSRLASRDNALTMPLASWNVQRDPGRYGHLVLLLIGTLALGTAALALNTTRDRSSWQFARNGTGGEIGAVIDTGDWSRDWAAAVEAEMAFPDAAVENQTVVYHQESTPQGSRWPLYLVGVDPEPVAEMFPDAAGALELIPEAPELPGLPIPAGAKSLELWALSKEGITYDLNVGMIAYIIDAVGARLEVPLQGKPNAYGEWVLWSAEIPAPASEARAPWRLVGLGFTTREIRDTEAGRQSFQHTIYFDDMAVVLESGERVILDDFEKMDIIDTSTTRTAEIRSQPKDFYERDFMDQFEGEYQNWRRPDLTVRWLADEVGIEQTESRVHSGTGALQIDYTVSKWGGGFSLPGVAVGPPVDIYVPVVLSTAYAEQNDLEIGQRASVEVALPHYHARLYFTVTGLTDLFPTFNSRSDRFLVANRAHLLWQANAPADAETLMQPNAVWFGVPAFRSVEPDPAWVAALEGTPGVVEVNRAYRIYGQLRREPLPNAIAGVLFAGFWMALGLSVLDFAFYLVISVRRRSLSFAVLRSLGWDARSLWEMLASEHVILIIPALVIGVLLGFVLAYLLLPFLALLGGEALALPLSAVSGLVATLLAIFGVLLLFAAWWLRRMVVTNVLRLGEE